MISSVNNNYTNNSYALKNPNNNRTSGNNSNLFGNTQAIDENSYVDISKMSPLAATVDSQGRPCTILSQKADEVGKNRPNQIKDMCDRYNNLKLRLVTSKKASPKTSSLYSKIESKLDTLMNNMKAMQQNLTAESLSLHKCETVEEVDKKIAEINEKQEAAYNEFCVKVDILEAIADTLPKLDKILENAANGDDETMALINEIIDSVDVSNPDFSKAKGADEIKAQSKERVDNLLKGDVVKKIKEVNEELDEKQKAGSDKK